MIDNQAAPELLPDYRRIVDKQVDAIIDELRKEGAVKPFSVLESAILKRLTDLGDAKMKSFTRAAQPSPDHAELEYIQVYGIMEQPK